MQALKISTMMFFCLFSLNSLQAQDPFLDMMNGVIRDIKYVFEARIDSVQAYPGDRNGKPVPKSNADWSSGTGNFDSVTYSKVWISVCRLYKGHLPQTIILLIPNPYVHSYAFIQPNGDTTIGFLHSPPSHGDRGSPLLPSKSYPITNLYFCYDVLPATTKGIYTMQQFAALPMKVPGLVPNDRGYFDQGIVYAFAATKTMMSQAELSAYLKHIKTLNADALLRCK